MTGKTEIWTKEIHIRTQRYRRRYDKHILFGLTMMNLFLLTGIGVLLRSLQMPGISMVVGGYGTVLLREGASSYIVVGIVAFVTGIVFTVICIRGRKKNKRYENI